MTDTASPAAPAWRDFYEMCKPRVVMLMILTSLVGMLLALPGDSSWLTGMSLLEPAGSAPWHLLPQPFPHPWNALLFGNIGIALVAASGAVVNHLIDRRIDGLMHRTRNRPLPQGRVEPLQAVLFALALGVTGMAVLLLWVNPLCAWLTLGSFIGYAFIYTGYLKHATPQNIVIGGLSGAMPPLLGWSAITGSIAADALILVLIIFTWTPPHFWALAIHRKDEYARSGVPMLPVTHGERVTKLHILAYTALLLPVSALPFFSGLSGWLYLLSALTLGTAFLLWALRLLLRPTPQTPIQTFRYSILYLALLFPALLLDHYLLPI